MQNMQSAKEILHTYLRIYRSISEEYRGRFGNINLTFPQTLVLSLLSSEGSMPISELARATGSANSTISGVLDRLEQMDLIQRVRSEKDRRVVYVTLTPHFDEVREELEGSVEDSFPGLIDKLSPEEVEQVRTGLEVLERALKRED
ncbi:MAG: MarR family transcriptional regulator [Candidatus Onthomonas sp.]|nr:MarR family transcriptional regulator [Candidatus Onthomonas sp.]